MEVEEQLSLEAGFLEMVELALRENVLSRGVDVRSSRQNVYGDESKCSGSHEQVVEADTFPLVVNMLPRIPPAVEGISGNPSDLACL